MNEAQRKMLKKMLERRTEENTRSKSDAKKWIMQDGMHQKDGQLKKRFRASRQQAALEG